MSAARACGQVAPDILSALATSPTSPGSSVRCSAAPTARGTASVVVCIGPCSSRKCQRQPFDFSHTLHGRRPRRLQTLVRSPSRHRISTGVLRFDCTARPLYRFSPRSRASTLIPTLPCVARWALVQPPERHIQIDRSDHDAVATPCPLTNPPNIY